MAEKWHDINDPGFFKRKIKEEPKNTSATEAESGSTAKEVEKEEKPEPEVRLISAGWEPGPKGFQHNEQCFLEVQTEYLKKTGRAQIKGKLYGIFNGEEFDLSQEVEGSIDDKTNIATLEIKHLFYVNNDHYDAWCKDPKTPSAYIVKEITHSRGEKAIDGPKLEMPVIEKIDVDFVEIADTRFHHNCALPSLDSEGELIAELGSVFSFSKEHEDRELVVEGHADRSGDEEYNLRISKRRAETVKALLENADSLWNGVVDADGRDHKIEPEDYQQTLKSLSMKFGWSCDPGAVDNKYGPKTKEGVQNFQKEYNRRFPDNEQLQPDGDVGPKTWKAVFDVLRNLIEKHVKTSLSIDPIPKLTYGYPEGDGIYPCGECSPVSGVERSQEDRRVELVFYEKGKCTPVIAPSPGKTCGNDTDPVTGKPWKKNPIPITPAPTVAKKAVAVMSMEEGNGVPFESGKKEQTKVKLILEIKQEDSGASIPFDGKATLEAENNGEKIQLWDSTKARLTLPYVIEGANVKPKMELTVSGVSASSSPEDVVLKCTLEKAGSVDVGAANPTPIKLSVIEVAFSGHADNPGGFDAFETITSQDQNGTAVTEDITQEYSFVSIEKSKTGKVSYAISGAAKEDIYFTSKDDSIAVPVNEQPDGISGALEITAKAKNKAETILYARYKSKTGIIVANMGVVVLKHVAYEAEFYKIKDSHSVLTSLQLGAITGTVITEKVKKYYKQVICELTVSGGSSELDVDYDSNAKSMTNGILDLEPGIDSAEQKIIQSKCGASAKKRIVYIHQLRWCYFLRADATAGSKTIKLKNYGKTYLGYIGTGNYTIEDDHGVSETVAVESVNTNTGDMTIKDPLSNEFKKAKKSAIIFPLGGLSGNPVFVCDGGTEDMVAHICAHELGHECAGWNDVCEEDNVLFGIARGGVRLRHRPLKEYYDTAKKSKQWLSMKGR